MKTKINQSMHLRNLSVLAAFTALPPTAQSAIVFSSDFDSVIPTEISAGTALITPVQGYSGLGPSGNVFGGSFLRSQTANVVTLQLTGLPAHDTVSLSLLFAAIDSLDGTGNFPQGDFFQVTLDNVMIFNESFANATPSQIQSYVAPTGVELARRVDLGFGGPGGFFTDSAYNLGADPVFSNIAHSASTLTLQFAIQGAGIQDLSDESWAMDQLTVAVNGIPEPSAALLLPCGLPLCFFRRAPQLHLAEIV